MATKTFTDGSILKASDLNTYCANPLYTVIGSGSFTTATTFDVTGFTNTYDDFMLVVRSVYNGVNGAVLQGTFMSGATNYTNSYYGGGLRATFGGVLSSFGNTNNGSSWNSGFVTNNGTTLVMAINGMNNTSRFPNATTQMFMDSLVNISLEARSGTRYINGISYDGIRFTHASATGTGYWTLSAVRKP
jgi:hypothetical protein